VHPLQRRPAMPGNQHPEASESELCIEDVVYSACTAKFLANLLCVTITNYSCK
jgi:hypothetical protein